MVCLRNYCDIFYEITPKFLLVQLSRGFSFGLVFVEPYAVLNFTPFDVILYYIPDLSDFHIDIS